MSAPDIHAVMAAMVDDAAPLADTVAALIAPLSAYRDTIRDHFLSTEQIQPIPDSATTLRVAATDGACLTEQTIIGDTLAVLAVTVIHDSHTSQLDIHDQHQHTAFRPHHPDNDLYVTAHMLAHERALAAGLDDTMVSILDGTPLTAPIALCAALGTRDDRLRSDTIALIRATDFPAAVAATTAAPLTVACPKSDSSTDLWQTVTSALAVPLPPLPDKAFAALILNPGEVLHSTPAARSRQWDALHAAHAAVSDPRGRILADRIRDAVMPLADTHGQPTTFHLKPDGATAVIRVDTTPACDDPAPALAAIADATAPPFILEPIPQHMADTFAKHVSALTNVQMEELRLALCDQGMADFLDYLHHYRTTRGVL